MPMFFSNYFDNYGFMNGFGGTTTSTRRLQIRYSNMGFSFAVMEDDVMPDAVNSASEIYQNSSGQNELYYKDNGKKVPRLAIGYTYNKPNILAKIAATFSAGKGVFQNGSSNPGLMKYLMGYGITAGVKPMFLDNKLWFSVVARFGMNEDIYGEGRTIYNGGIYYNSSNILTAFVDKDTTTYNVFRVSALLEIGYTFNKYISLAAGGGYQYSYTKNPYTIDTASKAYSRYDNVGSFAVYIQAPVSVNEYLSFTPQISYTQTDTTAKTNINKTEKYLSIAAGLQMNVRF